MTSYLQTAGWALIHFVWQGTMIAAGVSVLLRLARRRSASTRYVIACASLAAMLATPVVTARLMWTAAPPPIDRASTTRMREAVAQNSASVPAPGKAGDLRSGSPMSLTTGANLTIERFLPAVTAAWLAGVLEARDFPLEHLAGNLDLAAAVVAERLAGGDALAARLRDAAALVRGRETFL